MNERTGSSSNVRLPSCRRESKKRRRKHPVAFRPLLPLLLHIVAAMLSHSYVGTLHRFGNSRRSIVALALQSTTSVTDYSRRRRLLCIRRIEPCSACPIRDNSRKPPSVRVAPIRHRECAGRLEVAKFAFAEMSSAVASALSSPSSPVPPALGAYDIRCSVTGRVVCERVIDLWAPEGRCVGYAVPALVVAEDDDGKASQASSHSLASVAELQSPRHWIREYLHPREVEHGMGQPSEVGRTSFLLGRLALRQALECVAKMDGGVDADRSGAHSPATTTTTVPFRSSSHNFADWVLLKDAYGRPSIPRGFLGSVSHKKNVAVALVARDDSIVDGANLVLRAPLQHDTSTTPRSILPLPTRGLGVDLEAAASRNKISIARKVLTADEIDALGSVPVRTDARGAL
jgi:4'-phosphopantetheinyl transferase N-terminal domain